MNARPGRAAGVMSYLSLFTSVGTLVCCALPSLLVLLGLGATVASVLSAVPWLVTLSRHKPVVFSVAGVMIAASFVYHYRIAPRLRAAACAPGDAACDVASRAARVLLWVSAALYAVGCFVAFALGPILTRLD